MDKEQETRCAQCQRGRGKASESGYHYGCTLPRRYAANCLSGREDKFIEERKAEHEPAAGEKAAV